MFQDQYTKLNPKDSSKALSDFKSHLDGSAFPDTSVIMRRPLSFYPDHWFYDLADHQTMPPRRRFLIVNKNNITVLDGDSQTILKLNNAVPLLLNDENIIDYIQFYLSFTRGVHGRMLLIESLDDIPWRDDPSPAARKAIGKMISAIEPTSSISGAYHTKAQLIFGDGLYEVDLHVDKNGTIEFKDPKMLIEDMPVLDDILGLCWNLWDLTWYIDLETWWDLSKLDDIMQIIDNNRNAPHKSLDNSGGKYTGVFNMITIWLQPCLLISQFSYQKNR